MLISSHASRTALAKKRVIVRYERASLLRARRPALFLNVGIIPLVMSFLQIICDFELPRWEDRRIVRKSLDSRYISGVK